jgi:hypothetical protein
VEQKLDNINPNVVEKLLEAMKPPADDADRREGAPAAEKESLLQEPGIMDNVDMFDRKPERLKGVKVTKEVSMPMLQSEKINTPSYITYYQIVRDRIRDRAYSNYTKLSVGRCS